jgi:hypothetical protein
MHLPLALHLAPAAATLEPLRRTLRSLLDEWRRRRHSRLTDLALCGLDARTLRDLGFDGSELSSVAHDLASPHRSDRACWLSGPRF